ncbi:MAG: hypothetical protein ACRDGT_09785 [Candidatus Limnocylindria bacterium]
MDDTERDEELAAAARWQQARNDRQLERARRWQTERLRALIRRIERDGFQEVTQEQIDAVFTEMA